MEKGDIKTAFEKITGMEYSQDNIVKFMNGEITTKSEQALNGYKEGQDMAVDVIGDMVSGIAAVGIYSLAVAAAPFSGGASIASNNYRNHTVRFDLIVFFPKIALGLR